MTNTVHRIPLTDVLEAGSRRFSNHPDDLAVRSALAALVTPSVFVSTDAAVMAFRWWDYSHVRENGPDALVLWVNNKAREVAQAQLTLFDDDSDVPTL